MRLELQIDLIIKHHSHWQNFKHKIATKSTIAFASSGNAMYMVRLGYVRLGYTGKVRLG